MREIFFDGAGGPEVIKLREAPVPAPGPGKVLVEVVAAGINRPDCIQRAASIRRRPARAKFPVLKSPAGSSRSDEGVDDVKIGDEICALVGSRRLCGILPRRRRALPARPEALSLIEAAGVARNLLHRL